MEPEQTIKAIGNQWYWSYESMNYNFDSFMIDELMLEYGQLYNQTVDNALILPINTSIRILVTSVDVIHSFAVPSLALKLDAIPGRINSTGLIINRPATFYGQCSELCGVLHGMMPIMICGIRAYW